MFKCYHILAAELSYRYDQNQTAHSCVGHLHRMLLWPIKAGSSFSMEIYWGRLLGFSILNCIQERLPNYKLIGYHWDTSILNSTVGIKAVSFKQGFLVADSSVWKTTLRHHGSTHLRSMYRGELGVTAAVSTQSVC
jgi:hypothetical protein